MTGVALVTGASGYVGGRLVPALLASGWSVRAMVRKASRLRDYPWAADVTVVEGDVLDVDSLAPALDGADVVYYLVHAIGSGADFEATDRRAAENFATAARAAGVRRIVYLGGMTPEGEEL
ncbi:MAG: NAD(P)H-binding protein, partial [Actinomycetota bacterium]|nr:NAD(P)H-binding protein [Actinomycetota bacterium]